MNRDQLHQFSRTFLDPLREKEFIAHSWSAYSSWLRAPLILLGLFVSIGMYLDHMWYQFGAHFFAFGSFRLSVTIVAFAVAYLCTKPQKSSRLDWSIAALQLYFLIFIIAMFYDRMYLNDNGIVSESFFTVLFVTYPLLVFYVIRGNILLALLNSSLALCVYITIIYLLPQVSLLNRITELLVFLFFIYYSLTLQRRLNTNEREQFALQQKQDAAVELAQKENLEKSRFIAGTSHDLRQPLHALSLHIDLLDNQLKGDFKSREYLDNAKTSISTLNGLLSALLDISKLDAKEVNFNKVHFRLDTLLEKLHTVYGNLTIRLRIHNPPRIAHTDPVVLERAIGNLLNNAIAHASGGDILLASRIKGNSISIEVWDQGPGIPEDQIDMIFSEYHQLPTTQSERRGGLGLGLSIVKRICRSLELGLSVRSTLNKGSKFSISVPIGDAEQLVTPPKSTAQTPSALMLAGRKLLLIDDEPEVRHAMQALFDSWGCEATIAKNRRELFSLIRPENVPDLIISDLNLPEEVTGEDLIEEIRNFYNKPIPAMLITGNTNYSIPDSPEEKQLLLLYKPLRAAQLRLAISRLLNSSTTAT
ncbi:MAG: ATP-binding response regulator [Gammaproteobacteria bacterium]